MNLSNSFIYLLKNEHTSISKNKDNGVQLWSTSTSGRWRTSTSTKVRVIEKITKKNRLLIMLSGRVKMGGTFFVPIDISNEDMKFMHISIQIRICVSCLPSHYFIYLKLCLCPGLFAMNTVSRLDRLRRQPQPQAQVSVLAAVHRALLPQHQQQADFRLEYQLHQHQLQHLPLLNDNNIDGHIGHEHQWIYSTLWNHFYLEE